VCRSGASIPGLWQHDPMIVAGTSDKTTHVFQQFPILGGGIEVGAPLASGKIPVKVVQFLPGQ